MPDPLRQTISATESPALFGASPYATAWMLYRRFAHGDAIDDVENNRMSWGKKMQPLLLQAAAEDLKLEVHANPVDADGNDVYVRRVNRAIGCTRDGTIICPDRGPGAIETKCVFDYKVWAEKWSSGKRVPPEYEIQLQHQMLVGDGTFPFRWGTLAAWVCGQMVYFERDPIAELWEAIETEAAAFFGRVAAKDEPEPFGSPVEAPLLAELFPPVPDSVLDLRDDPDHVGTSEDVAMYKHLRETEAGAERARKQIQAKLLGIAKENEKVLLPCGVNFRRKKSGKGYTIDAYVPENPDAAPLREPVLMAG
jgi:hypothetical protein